MYTSKLAQTIFIHSFDECNLMLTSPVERHQIPTQVEQINIELVLKIFNKAFKNPPNIRKWLPNVFSKYNMHDKNTDKCYKTFIKHL